MKRARLYVAPAFVVALAGLLWCILTPRIRTATRAEIDAVLPVSLRVQDPFDPAARRRYDRFRELVNRVAWIDDGVAAGFSSRQDDPWAVKRFVAQIEGTAGPLSELLREGAIQPPLSGIERRLTDDERDESRDYARSLALVMKDAAKRGDRAMCLRYAALGLRFSRVRLKGGMISDVDEAAAIDEIVVQAVVDADDAGGFDAAGRRAILDLLPIEDGRLREMGAMLRREFQRNLLPALLDPHRFLTEAATYGRLEERTPERNDVPAGTFDSVETARLTGAVYDAAIAEVSRAGSPTGAATRMAWAAVDGLPDPPEEEGALRRLWYRVQMNAGQNTIGRRIAAECLDVDRLLQTARRRAANHNLVRAVFLLRMGRPAHVPDPFGTGDLRVDPKRRLVWSVGEDGKDDGGDFETSSGFQMPDVGYPY